MISFIKKKNDIQIIEIMSASFVLELSSFDVFVLAQLSTQFEFYHISDILVSLFENKQNELNILLTVTIKFLFEILLI